jgi:CubicO group peptidase (beta-lactamase class C family)
MSHWYALALLFMTTVFDMIAAEGTQVPPTDTKQVLERIRAKYDFPGLAVIVVKAGKVCDLAAVGVRKHGDPTLLTTNDVFHLGSCTKSMTATLAAMLVEEGKLRWDTTIAGVFPELKGRIDRQYENVTLEQLLTQRGGVPSKPPAEAWKRAWEEHGTPQQQRYEFIQSVLREPPEARPATRYIYSNQGYAIAGAMLEKVAGVAWEQLIIDRLFKPLHMNSAGFGPPGSKGRVDQPWGHTIKNRLIVPLQEDNPPAIAPAGRVHCSLSDLATYAVFHMEGERQGGLLKQETLRKLHTPADGGDNKTHYAFGWICVKRAWAGGPTIMHNGSNTMWYLAMWLAPEKDFAVIVATNTGVGDTFQGCDEVAAQMIKRWCSKVP